MAELTRARYTDESAMANERIWQLEGPSEGVVCLKTIDDAISYYDELVVTRVGARIVRLILNNNIVWESED